MYFCMFLYVDIINMCIYICLYVLVCKCVSRQIYPIKDPIAQKLLRLVIILKSSSLSSASPGSFEKVS